MPLGEVKDSGKSARETRGHGRDLHQGALGSRSRRPVRLHYVSVRVNAGRARGPLEYQLWDDKQARRTQPRRHVLLDRHCLGDASLRRIDHPRR
jgi:hypothetical protein